MGRRSKDTTITVHEGLYLKESEGVLHCYFRLGGTQFRRSTRTSDLAEAKLLALKWHKDAQRKFDLGESVEAVSFARLKRSYLDHIKGQGKLGYHKDTIERHLLHFFSRFDDVSKIKKADIINYVKFRKGQGDDQPTPQTINRENTVLRQMLKYAVDMGWLRTAPVIDAESERHSRRRRRHFTLEEYQRLYKTARERAKEKGLRSHHTMMRQLLLDYILLLANTGMRVDESKTLIWRNVDWDNKTLLLEHAGKTKNTRRVLMREGAVRALKRIYQRRQDWLKSNEGKFSENEKIVSLANGTFVSSFKKGFDQVLEAAGFRYNDSAEKHALTSLRHTYATFRLTTKSGKRASVRALAKQMGTSERMIERHYGHDVVEDYREELTSR